MRSSSFKPPPPVRRAMHSIFTAILAFILAALAPLHGQDQTASDNAPVPIVTDRPTVTNSSIVVPSGSLETTGRGTELLLYSDRQVAESRAAAVQAVIVVRSGETQLGFCGDTKTQ